ncbi:ATP-dependent DNA helicase [Thermococcus sp. GR7]|uniref:ATP-dependent DNA helicase n=1 Tax=unclassified Thermococcus TaxID=2627626 RepID=UPI0014307D5E|nr:MULTISPECIES: ATP-dependent DNA helicase [unclassified Thermococcus]NJE46821.1 ATP-dependent DNA helicase [Thermococcus sp. GR7]NJE78318.1 ATP-dependent DNA helicase [Thermococcus sp. GR4]NJF23385.1 ATP-dependent DNA helicase [Thermococcus sp. GR5]
MRVEELPVDKRIKRIILERGIEELYPPQAEALRSGVLEGKNLVLAIPTASGKTLVSEIVMVNKLLREGGKAVYLVPLKALAEEKYREFKEWEVLGLRVAATTGDYDSTDEWLGRYDIIVATAEKFDSLLRHGSSWIKDVKLVVADEVHLIGSYDRGATLEMILSHMLGRAQILALSATVGNAEELAEWLNAELVVSNWRPVQLRKGVFAQGELFWEDGKIDRYPANWDSLAIDAVKRGKQALIFVNTRRSAEKEAVSLAPKIARLLTKPEQRGLKELADSLESNPTNEKLKKALRGGVAFHHAGLSRTERTMIEDAFREGLIKVITATPTLSAGLNLPAFRVIIRDTKRYSNFGWVDIPVLEIQQMMGRAGRPKYDKVGEAIIVARTEDPKKLMDRYVFGKPEKLFSMLANESAFRGQILALITNFGVENFRELINFLEKTFYFYQRSDTSHLEWKAKEIVYFLIENEFIDMDIEDRFIALPFGRRTSQLYIDPLTAKKFKDAFPKLEKNPNPFGIFQLIASTPDMGTLNARRKEMEDYLDLAYEMEEKLYVNIPYWEDYRFQSFLNEVKTAKILLDWINEVPETRIYDTYNIDPGDLYRILELADWLMYSLIELYKLFEPKKDVLDYLRDLHLRLKHGVREELLELVRLPNIGRKRARALYNAGFRTTEDIMKAKVSELLAVEGIGLKVVEGLFMHFGVELPKASKKSTEENRKRRKGTLDDFLK